ncbi:MAG: hypothetical protein IPG93_00165 [Burkholderiales bacterium]|nr:hypothetical protein [Burkholderiales bacterium]
MKPTILASLLLFISSVANAGCTDFPTPVDKYSGLINKEQLSTKSSEPLRDTKTKVIAIVTSAQEKSSAESKNLNNLLYSALADGIERKGCAAEEVANARRAERIVNAQANQDDTRPRPFPLDASALTPIVTTRPAPIIIAPPRPKSESNPAPQGLPDQTQAMTGLQIVALSSENLAANYCIQVVAEGQFMGWDRKFYNACEFSINVHWCAVGVDCKYGDWGYNNASSIGPGQKTTATSAGGNVGKRLIYGACKGRYTFVRPIDKDRYECGAYVN